MVTLNEAVCSRTGRRCGLSMYPRRMPSEEDEERIAEPSEVKTLNEKSKTGGFLVESDTVRAQMHFPCLVVHNV